MSNTSFNTTLIIGESGTGKSTSIRNLNPKETFIINVLNKPLPFRGYKKHYSRISPDGSEGNYYASDDYNLIIKVIKLINEKRTDVKNLIIDDWQYTMCNEFMRRATESGYGKFAEIGQHAWLIVNALKECREDLSSFVLSHSEMDSSGQSKIKTIGKMLDEKVGLEGMFTAVLHSLIIDGEYLFLTNRDGVHMAKSPIGMFEDKHIANDLLFVKEKIDHYFNEDVA